MIILNNYFFFLISAQTEQFDKIVTKMIKTEYNSNYKYILYFKQTTW